MKKTITLLLALALLLSVFSLAGCGKKEVKNLTEYATVQYNPKKVNINIEDVAAVDGSWTGKIQIAGLGAPGGTTAGRLEYTVHQKNLQSEKYLNRELGEKQLGDYKYTTATYEEKQADGSQVFGVHYYCEFEPELMSTNGMAVRAVTARYSGPQEKLAEFEAILSTLEINTK